MALLLKNGAEIDARDRNLETPLLLATRTGHTEATMYLLKAGANAKACDRMGRNILMHAIKSGNLELVDAMMAYERGAAGPRERSQAL
jgi:ankyrin repeat protein